jgi:hypothetical protein
MSDASSGPTPIARTSTGYRVTTRLRRRGRALLIQTDGNVLDDLRLLYRSPAIEDEYRRRDYDVVKQSYTHWEPLIAYLRGAAEAPFARVLFLAHGGWDGPILGEPSDVHTMDVAQANAGTPKFEAFGSALAAATLPDARIYISACHGAGSDAAERVGRVEHRNGDARSKSWTSALHAACGRFVAGPAGSTAWHLTVQAARCALERDGPAPQELAVFDGGRGLAIRAGETFEQAQAVVLEATATPTTARINDVITLSAWPATPGQDLYVTWDGREYKRERLYRAAGPPNLVGQVLSVRLQVPPEARLLRVRFHGDEVPVQLTIDRTSGRLARQSGS